MYLFVFDTTRGNFLSESYIFLIWFFKSLNMDDLVPFLPETG